jgi:opacity protein-like surface antigen
MKKLFVILAILGVAVFTIGDANASVGLRSIGVGAGYASPDNIDGTWTAGLYMDFGVPVTNLYVQPFINYWSWEESVSGLASASISDWTIGGNLKYVIPTSAPKFRPYIQGGVAAHLMTAEAELNLFGTPTNFSVSDTKVGFQLGAGAAFDLTERFALFGQGSYHIVQDFNQWMAGGGVQINL